MPRHSGRNFQSERSFLNRISKNYYPDKEIFGDSTPRMATFQSILRVTLRPEFGQFVKIPHAS